MTRTTNGMNKGSISRPVHSPPERCIIRTSLRLNGVQVHHQGQNLGGLQNTGGGDGTGGTPGGGGTDSKLPHRHRHTKCVGERQARYGHSPFEQANMGLEPPPVLYVDGAYVCGPSLREAQEDFRELHGPAPASPDRGKVFTVEAFDIKVEERRRSVRPGRPVVTVVGCARKRPARWIIDSNGTAPFVAYVQEGRSASPPRRPTIRWSSANITPCCRPVAGRC